jgi:hypothetical protein
MNCLNLRELYGDRHRIDHDESYAAERGRYASAEEIFLQIIDGAAGHVFAWDFDRLAASTRGRGSVAKRLVALDGIEIVQDGSDGVTVTFRPDLFDQVADMLRLRKRRRLSPEARARLAEAGAKTRFGNGTQSPYDDEFCVPAA